jgi:hypothetical protein
MHLLHMWSFNGTYSEHAENNPRTKGKMPICLSLSGVILYGILTGTVPYRPFPILWRAQASLKIYFKSQTHRYSKVNFSAFWTQNQYTETPGLMTITFLISNTFCNKQIT